MMMSKKLIVGVSLLAMLVGAGAIHARISSVAVGRLLAGLDQPVVRFEAGKHVATSERHSTEFDGRSFAMTSRSLAGGDGAKVRYALSEIRKGSEVLAGALDAIPAVSAESNRIEYRRRGAIVERYDVAGRGIEQSFVLPARSGHSGDLTIAGTISSDRPLGAVTKDGSGGLQMALSGSTLHYGAVTAIDAAGRRQPGSVDAMGNTITLTVDGAWLDAASYPVIVDPFIVIEASGAYDGKPAIAFDPGEGAPADFPPQYLLVYEKTVSGVTQIYGRRLDRNGATIGGPGTSFHISAGAPALHNFRPTVAFKYGKALNGPPARFFLVSWYQEGGGLLARALNANGAFVGQLLQINSLGRDPDAASSPYPTSGCGTAACYPFAVVYRSTSCFTTCQTHLGRAMINVHSNVVGVVSDSLIESLGIENGLFQPKIAYGHADTPASDGYVIAYRRGNGQITYRKMDSGGSVNSAFEIGGSTGIPAVTFSRGQSGSGPLNRWAIVRPAVLFFGTNYLLGTIYNATLTPDLAFQSSMTLQFGAGFSAPEFSLASTQNKVDGQPYSLFELAMAAGSPSSPDGYEPYSAVFRSDTGAFVGGLTLLNQGGGQQTKADRFIRVAAGKTDTDAFTNYHDSCNGAPTFRCALRVWEHYFGSVDHDIHGNVTTTHY